VSFEHEAAFASRAGRADLRDEQGDAREQAADERDRRADQNEIDAQVLASFPTTDDGV
jgi:hypothetical protein